MVVPLVDLKAQYRAIKEEIDEAVLCVLARTDFIQGEDVPFFEKEFAAFCNTKEAVGVSSGTEALRLALLSYGIGPGDEVITTPFTFIATAEAISQVGARPVFVDIDPRSFNLDPAKLEAAITGRTKAVIPVHLYGRPADMAPIMSIASAYNLKVIEDAAQAHGATYRGEPVGTIGDVGTFSFYPGKNLGAYGDAGIVVTNDPDVAESIRMLRDHGQRQRYEHLYLGYNARLDTIQAAVLRVKLRHLPAWNNRRKAIAAMYQELLQECGLEFPSEDESVEPVYHLFVVRTPYREHLQGALSAAGIATGVHYPIPLHMQPAYRHLRYRPGSFPESERAAREVLSLPMYPELSDEQVFMIAQTLREVLSACKAGVVAAG